ncbi:hypothetical protein Tco_1009057 [Tanacetum coccineum]
MSELPNDAIGIYHRIFDLFGVRIHFSSFLLDLIKHYRLHFSQLGPLGQNKVITFEVLCWSLQIEPTVALFRVFQTLCKQAGSFSMADVRRLSAHVIKLRDMHERVLVLFGLSRVWKSRVCDLLWRLSFYCTSPAAADAVIPDPTLKDLAVGTPSVKILAKAKASQKRKASTSGATLSHVAKSTSDDDGDACVEIPLVTPIHSRGKGIMVDDAVAPSVGASRQRPSSSFVPSFRDVSEDVIYADFFPFSAGFYYAAYPEGGVAGNCEFTQEEWDAPYRTTFGVLTKKVFKDPTVYKTMMSVLYCMMISHGGELLDRYCGLLQSYHEQVAGLNDKLSTSDAAFAKSKAKGKERKKKIKSLSKSIDQLNAEVARLSTALNQANVLEAEKDKEILWLKATPSDFATFFRDQFQGLVQKFLASDEFSRVQGELLSLAASAGFERELSMHRTKDEFAAVLKKMAHFVPGTQGRLAETSPLVAVIPSSRNQGGSSTAPVAEGPSTQDFRDKVLWDVSGDAIHADFFHFSAGPYYATYLEGALSPDEKGDGSLPSSASDEEATANPFGV